MQTVHVARARELVVATVARCGVAATAAPSTGLLVPDAVIFAMGG